MAMDLVDCEIVGSEMQFVEVELDPGEAAIGGAGSMMFMDAGIGMDTIFGDGSANQSLPFLRLASRVFAAAPQRGGSREEGGVLGGLVGSGLLGGILGGDDE